MNFVIYYVLSVIKLPVQEVPSPENPSLHSHVYEPIKFSHLAFVLQRLEIHSLMSKIFNEIFIKFKCFLRIHKYNHGYKKQNIIVDFNCHLVKRYRYFK